MIVVELIGGLGNQMFQYAAGRALAERLGTSLRLDTFSFDASPLRDYSLHHFQQTSRVATRLDVIHVRGRPTVRRIARAVRAGSVQHVFTERSSRFDPTLFDCPDGTYLRGYWQSSQYFASIAPLIRADFQLRAPLSPRLTELLEEVRANSAAVSLHVRRGDYAADPRIRRIHGLVCPQYYRKALAAVRADVPDATFYAFSDDPEWLYSAFGDRDDVRVVSGRHGLHDYEELILMSECRHLILANSSFSWWAAWLRDTPGQRVIAPRDWFRDPALGSNDLLPTNWQQL